MNMLGGTTVVLRRETAGVRLVVADRPTERLCMRVDHVDEARGGALTSARSGHDVGSSSRSRGLAGASPSAFDAGHRVRGEHDRDPEASTFALDDRRELAV